MTSSLLQRLKEETRAQHEDLEEQLQLLRPQMTLPDYQSVLEGFYGFYNPFERYALPALGTQLFDFFSGRRKTPLLEKDLKVLGSNLTSIPQSFNLPAIHSELVLLGSFYVLEGSTLGGQILGRHFTKKFNLSYDQGCSFFYSYGPDVGSRWREFCDLLTSYSSASGDAIIVEAAISTFGCLQEWLQQQGAVVPC